MAFERFAERLEAVLGEQQERPGRYPAAVVAELRILATVARCMALMGREVDLLIGDETGPDEFIERVRELKAEQGELRVEKGSS